MSRNNVLEKYIIDLCSPTLASLKTASLINCYFINEKQLEKDMAELNLLLNILLVFQMLRIIEISNKKVRLSKDDAIFFDEDKGD